MSQLDQAYADVTDAKARLSDTVAEIQARVAPSRLLDEAVAGVKSTSATVLDGAGEAARQRPRLFGAAVGGIVLLILRRPLLRLLRRLLGWP